MKLDTVIAVRNNNVIYRDGDVCIKVFNEGYSKADVLFEALNQARIEQTGLNTPIIREVTMVDGKWAIIYDYIEGKTLQRLMDEDSENKEKYINMLVDLQLEVLSKTSPFLGRLKDKLNIKICQSALDATTRYDLHSKLEDMPKHSKVCHGNINPTNIIVGDDGKTCIIDWGHATQGNGAADAARTYLHFWLKGDSEGAKKYLELYCKKSDTAKQYVQKWVPIVAAALSVNVSEKERDFLLSWVNVVGYE